LFSLLEKNYLVKKGNTKIKMIVLKTIFKNNPLFKIVNNVFKIVNNIFYWKIHGQKIFRLFLWIKKKPFNPTFIITYLPERKTDIYYHNTQIH